MCELCEPIWMRNDKGDIHTNTPEDAEKYQQKMYGDAYPEEDKGE